MDIEGDIGRGRGQWKREGILERVGDNGKVTFLYNCTKKIWQCLYTLLRVNSLRVDSSQLIPDVC